MDHARTWQNDTAVTTPYHTRTKLPPERFQSAKRAASRRIASYAHRIDSLCYLSARNSMLNLSTASGYLHAAGAAPMAFGVLCPAFACVAVTA